MFAGIVGFGDSSLDPALERRLIQSLEGERLGRPRAVSGPSEILVARQRLVTPEDWLEQQPSTGDSGMMSLFDGRLDNRADLLSALGLPASAGASLADGEIVRAAYERWEEEAVPRLLGDFAWVVWNSRARRLMLARDHGCERSLFFARGDGFAAFATGYRPLLALPQISDEIDERAVGDMLAVVMTEDDRSFYKSILWVRPAERVVISASGMRRDRMWEPRANAVPVPRRDADILDAGRALFDAAVAARLRVKGPIVSTVSGGLDSSAVAATAARLRSPDPVHAVCIVPAAGRAAPVAAGRFGNERPFVDALAALHPNLQTHFVDCRGAGPFLESPESFFLQFGAPMWAANNGGWMFSAYRKAAELGAGAMLIGSMGNMTVSARGWEGVAGLAAEHRWLAFARELWAMARSDAPARRYVTGQSLAKVAPGLAAGWRRIRGVTVGAGRPVPLNADFVEASALPRRRRDDSPLTLDAFAPDARLRTLRFIMLRSRMAMEARAAMRLTSGITMADPFSHRPLIDFCLALPPEQFMHRGVARRFARRLFADRLPPMIVDNPDIGQQNADWHARLYPLKDAIVGNLDRLDRSALASRVIDLARLRRAVETWPADAEDALRTDWLKENRLFQSLHLACFLAWIDRGNAPSLTDSPGGA